MKGVKKFVACLAVVLAVAILQTSCASNFIDYGTGSSASESESSYQSGSDSNGESIQEPSFSFSDVNFDISFSESDLEPSDGAKIVEKIRPSVVEIHCVTSSGTSSGSGVILSFDDTDEDGVNDAALVVTCHHVIDGAQTNGSSAKSIFGDEYPLSLYASDPVSDVGLLYMYTTEDTADFSKLAAATMYPDSSKLIVGSDVYAIGNPLGYLGGTVTKGVVSALNRDVNVEGRQMTLIQTDAAINGGNSGGGLFDAATGALIGVVNAGYASSAAQGLSFAIPCGTVKSIIDQLQSKGYIEGNYSFGAEFELSVFSDGGGIYSKRFYRAVISSLDAYGTLAKGGLSVGDVVLSITIGDASFDGETNVGSSTLTALANFLDDEKYAIGDDVTVNYARYNSKTGNYEKNTLSFKIVQYRYGVI